MVRRLLLLRLSVDTSLESSLLGKAANMNLSDEVTKGLALFAADTPFDGDAFAKLLTLTLEILLKRKTEEALKGKD